MIPKEQFAKSASTSKSGFFATLRAGLHVSGISASKITQGTGAPSAFLHAQGDGASSAPRRLALASLLALATTFTALALTVAPAVAKTVHVLSGKFTGAGLSALSEPAGVAVNDTTKNVYVVDKGNKRVEWFNSAGTTVEGEFNGSVGPPTGAFVSPEFIAVNNSTTSLVAKEDVYVADTSDNVIDQFTASGTYVGELTGTCATAGEVPPACAGSTFVAFKALHGVAVDPEGNVWVYENEAADEGEVAEFSDTGMFVKAFRTERGAKPGIALDSSGHVYVVFGSGDVGEYEASTGTEVGKNEKENASGIAVDTGDMFIDTGSRVEEYGLTEPFSSPVEPSFPSEGLSGSEGIAAGATGTVYATERTAGSVEVFDEYPLPAVSTEAVSNLAVHSATLNGAVNPEGVPVTSCGFEYGTEAGVYPHKEPCVHTVPLTGSAPVAVTANLTGLSPDVAYHYRLVATNADHLTEATPDETFTARGPGISAEQVTHVEAAAATLQANIDPNESETTYHFEYDTTPYTSGAAHGTSLPVPNASLGSGTSPVPVSVRLQGLQPGGTYYYRVVVVSEPLGTPETFDGPDNALTTSALPSSAPEACPNAQLRSEQPYGPRLPDCRAYELVSPLEKGDDGVIFSNSRASVSDAAPAISYVSRGAFADPQSKIFEDRYISRRGPDGWSTANISPPYKSFGNGTKPPFIERFFSSELSKGVLYSANAPLVAGQPEGYGNLYLADLETGAYEAVTVTPPFPEVEPFRVTFGGAPETAGVSTDLSHVVFDQHASLLEGAPSHQAHVYEWTGGKLTLIDVSPEGIPFADDAWVGAAGNIDTAEQGDTWNAVSADGSRVFFGEDSEAGQGENHIGQLFVRENAERPQSPVVEGKCAVAGDACTVEVSRSQKTEGTGPGGTDPHGYHIFEGHEVPTPAFYRDASTDGARAFFTSTVELTNDANTGPEDNAANLYEYDVETGGLRDLTVDTNAGDPNGAAVLGLVTASDDGSYVYFVAEGDLAGAAVSGQPNLYLYHGGSVTFIATLAKAASGGGKTALNEEGGDSKDWTGQESSTNFSAGPGGHAARVTAGGVYLAFESQRPLTGYDNEQSRPGECEASLPQGATGEDGNCHEVFVYDAQTGSLVCASCNPSGARPIGGSTLGGEQGDSLQSSDEPFYLAQNLSEGGGRLFFQSRDALVPKDSNGLLNVYEWERAGVGSCTESSPSFSGSSGGCVLAISNVAGANDSRFMDATPSGENVFIATRDALVPAADGETRSNVYDVRVGGGFPVTVPPPVCTNADSCKPPVSPQPGVFGAPASATFSGPGDPVPTVSPPAVVKSAKKKAVKCKRNFVKKKIKKQETCVKKQRKKQAKRASRDRRGNR